MNKQKNKIIVAILALIILGGAGIVWQIKRATPNQGAVLLNKSRNLTSDQSKFYTERISKAEEYIKTLDPADQNYNQNLLNTYIYIAQQYFGLGELQKSKEWYEKAVIIKPEEPQSYVGLASVFEDAGDFNAQLSALQKAVDTAPSNSDIWIRLLNFKKQHGASVVEMNELYNTALEKTQRHIDILVASATYFGQNGNVEGAIKLWQEAMVKNPSGNSLYQVEIDKYKSTK